MYITDVGVALNHIKGPSVDEDDPFAKRHFKTEYVHEKLQTVIWKNPYLRPTCKRSEECDAGISSKILQNLSVPNVEFS
jgi:hypothetical protein